MTDFARVPVFEVADREKEDPCPYPGIWITVPIYDENSNYIGRDRIAPYPVLSPFDDIDFSFCDKPDEKEAGVDRDPGGMRALQYGGNYYEEGMSCRDKERRCQCFQAAELLYLHAAYRGNPYADVCLGYVYAYDRCDGWYLRTWFSESGKYDDVYELPDNPFPADEMAFHHFGRAAKAGIAEGCYKYGDMLKSGRGCNADPKAAFKEFERAFELGRHDSPTIWGSAALRLAECYEEGSGCKQSFKAALDWYKHAETGLGAAVRAGDSWYRNRLREAESGEIRMKQELSGAY